MIGAAPNITCPVCGDESVTPTVRRVGLPVMQNVVFTDAAAARSAPRGEFELGVCGSCGFAFNTRFDPALMVYDERYDNDVPSAAFERYYREIVEELDRRYGLRGELLCDVGCGKGRFLEIACATVPGLRGLGIDPSCTPRDASATSPVTLVRDIFRASHLRNDPALVVCRHVLEHIHHPVEFLRTLYEALADMPHVPVYIEVPDLDWIFDQGAFWDFCYEHCNYFTRESLGYALFLAGFEVEDTAVAFGGQYRWAYARRREGLVHRKPDAAQAITRARSYSEHEAERISSARDQAIQAAAKDVCVLWGMATKGVMFASLIDPGCKTLSFGVDINPKKQGRFAPVTGLPIAAPLALREAGCRAPTVFVMNPNYLLEVVESCREMGLSPILASV